MDYWNLVSANVHVVEVTKGTTYVHRVWSLADGSCTFLSTGQPNRGSTTSFGWIDLDVWLQDGHDTPLGVLVLEVGIVLKPPFFYEQRCENGR